MELIKGALPITIYHPFVLPSTSTYSLPAYKKMHIIFFPVPSQFCILKLERNGQSAIQYFPTTKLHLQTWPCHGRGYGYVRRWRLAVRAIPRSRIARSWRGNQCSWPRTTMVAHACHDRRSSCWVHTAGSLMRYDLKLELGYYIYVCQRFRCEPLFMQWYASWYMCIVLLYSNPALLPVAMVQEG